MSNDDPVVYCVCGCGRKRPLSKMYHYGHAEADGSRTVVGPVVKFHKLKDHRDD